MPSASNAPRMIPGKRPAKTAPAGNLLGRSVGWRVDGALETPGADVDEDAGTAVGEVLCGADVDIEIVDTEDAIAEALLVGWFVVED
jgi:hypothetical protein